MKLRSLGHAATANLLGNLQQATAASAARQMQQQQFSTQLREKHDDTVLIEKLKVIQAHQRGRSARQKVQWGVSIVRTTGTLLQRVRIRRMSELPLALARNSGKVTMTVEVSERLAHGSMRRLLTRITQPRRTRKLFGACGFGNRATNRCTRNAARRRPTAVRAEL